MMGIITSWSCNVDIIREVCVQSIGRDFALVYVNLNTDGKRATFSGFGGADSESQWRADLDVPLSDGTIRVATLTLHGDAPLAHVAAECDGAGEAFIVVRRQSPSFHLGETVPKVDLPSMQFAPVIPASALTPDGPHAAALRRLADVARELGEKLEVAAAQVSEAQVADIGGALARYERQAWIFSSDILRVAGSLFGVDLRDYYPEGKLRKEVDRLHRELSLAKGNVDDLLVTQRQFLADLLSSLASLVDVERPRLSDERTFVDLVVRVRERLKDHGDVREIIERLLVRTPDPARSTVQLARELESLHQQLLACTQ